MIALELFAGRGALGLVSLHGLFVVRCDQKISDIHCNNLSKLLTTSDPKQPQRAVRSMYFSKHDELDLSFWWDTVPGERQDSDVRLTEGTLTQP